MGKIIDGKAWANKIQAELKVEIAKVLASGKRAPELAVIQVGTDSASSIYVRNKRLACEKVGIKSSIYNLPADIGMTALCDLIQELNQADNVDGILCQLPLPDGYDEQLIISQIAPDKDVDGFHPLNKGLLSVGKAELVSCTPVGIITLLEREKIAIAGKLVLVIGRSNIVGKPVAQLLLQKNATVMQAHSYTSTEDLRTLCGLADIVIVAIGKAKFMPASWFKKDAVVIDVGINRDENGKLCGDVEADAVGTVARITPVPGGVGPMTVTSLLHNTYLSYLQHCEVVND